VQIIDQRHLPHDFVVEDVRTVEDMCVAIKDESRGAE
jgi:methylthioribose-1-phosphate isomerase